MTAPATVPLRRGFNLPEMFLGPDDLRWADMIRGLRGRFSETDFAWIADWGFNFVRLPMSYRWWATASAPSAIDEKTFAPVDDALAWASRHVLRLALCLHHAPGFVRNPPPQPDSFDLWRDEEALAFAVRATKGKFPRCGGFLVWMGHDAFPCLANTSLVDFARQLKPAAHALAEVFRSLAGSNARGNLHPSIASSNSRPVSENECAG